MPGAVLYAIYTLDNKTVLVNSSPFLLESSVNSRETVSMHMRPVLSEDPIASTFPAFFFALGLS